MTETIQWASQHTNVDCSNFGSCEEIINFVVKEEVKRIVDVADTGISKTLHLTFSFYVCFVLFFYLFCFVFLIE